MLGSHLLLALGWLALQAHQAHAKIVIGHWMGGETQRYTVDDYAADMRLSNEVGIGAWAVNSGKDTYEQDHLDLLFEAAKQENYKITLSVDMVRSQPSLLLLLLLPSLVSASWHLAFPCISH